MGTALASVLQRSPRPDGETQWAAVERRVGVPGGRDSPGAMLAVATDTVAEAGVVLMPVVCLSGRDRLRAAKQSRLPPGLEIPMIDPQ